MILRDPEISRGGEDLEAQAVHAGVEALSRVHRERRRLEQRAVADETIDRRAEVAGTRRRDVLVGDVALGQVDRLALGDRREEGVAYELGPAGTESILVGLRLLLRAGSLDDVGELVLEGGRSPVGARRCGENLPRVFKGELGARDGRAVQDGDPGHDHDGQAL